MEVPGAKAMMTGPRGDITKTRDSSQDSKPTLCKTLLYPRGLVPGSKSKSDPGPDRTTREPRPEPEWTPLNQTRAEILKEVKGKPFYYPPKPMLAPPESRS